MQLNFDQDTKKINFRFIVKMIFQYITLGALIFVALLLLTNGSEVEAKTLAQKLPIHIRTVKCDENRMIDVYIKPSFTTIINFPVKPDNVVLGSKNQFSVDYIKSDLAVSSLGLSSNTNLFVYLFGRRCGFLLITSSSNHDNLLLVRDPEEVKMKVQIK